MKCQWAHPEMQRQFDVSARLQSLQRLVCACLLYLSWVACVARQHALRRAASPLPLVIQHAARD